MPIVDFIREQGFRHDYLATRLGVTRTHFSRLVQRNDRLTVGRIYDLAAIMRLPVRDVAAAVIPEINFEEKT